jgi:hypothetical protein
MGSAMRLLFLTFYVLRMTIIPLFAQKALYGV